MVAYWSQLLADHQSQQREVEAQNRLRATQMALAVSVQVQTLLSGLDYTLESLSTVYSDQDRGAFDYAVHAVQASYPSDAVLQIAVADAAGEIVYSNLERGGRPLVAVSIADREHFQVHLRGQVQGLYVGRPVLGRVSQQWAIQVTRAIRHEGALLGVLVLSLSPQHVAQYFQAIAGEGRDVISLVRDDGVYLARSQLQAQVLGQDTVQEVEPGLSKEQARGSYRLSSGIDGVERDYAWSRVPPHALIAVVGLDRRALLAPLQASQGASTVRNALVSVFILAGALLTAWLALQRQRSDQRRLQAKRRFARLAQQAPGGLFQCGVSDQGRLQMLFTTAGFSVVHGLRAEGPTPTVADLTHCVHKPDRAALIASVRASVASLADWEHKYRVSDTNAPSGVRWLHGRATAQHEGERGVHWYGHVHDVTHDQLSQESIRLNEERLRATVHAVRDGLWQWDCVSGRVHWDARCYEMLGYSDGQLALDTESFVALLHPGDRDRVQQALERHQGKGESFAMEIRLRSATQAWHSIESRGEIVERDGQGRALCMLGMHSDIQQRVEQGRLIRALLDRGSALVMVATPERDIVYLNERAAQAFGLPSGRQADRLPFRTLHADDASYKRFGPLYDQIKREERVRTEVQLRTAHGGLNWFDMQGTLLTPEDEGGDVIWTLMDIDSRRRAEAALLEAQRILAAIIDRFPAGILVIDGQASRLVAANHMLTQALQLPLDPDTLVGLPLPVFASRLAPALASTLLQRDAQGELATGKTLESLPDGRQLEVEALALRDGARAIGHCWVFNDVTERRQREAQLETMALTDVLTGVPNRRAFMERLDTELQHLQAALVPSAALALLDIDHFKRVNDTHGHAIGDVVLRELAQTVARKLRRQDMVGRIGGEEFAVLLTGATPGEGLRRAEELRQAVAASQIHLGKGGVLSITISLGVYGMTAQDALAAQCLERADAAMYHSKRNGRNRSTLWRADLPDLMEVA